VDKSQRQLVWGAALGVLAVMLAVSWKTGRPATVTSSVALRRGQVNLTGGFAPGTWKAPHWQKANACATPPPVMPGMFGAHATDLADIGVTPLRLNHPLHRRPAYPGCNRDKVAQDGWGGWMYDPPSEVQL
jgi:hypothetical protein